MGARVVGEQEHKTNATARALAPVLHLSVLMVRRCRGGGKRSHASPRSGLSRAVVAGARMRAHIRGYA